MDDVPGRGRRARLPGGGPAVVHDGRRRLGHGATTRPTCAGSPAPGWQASPTTEVLLEESILGWKEYELELMRDRHDNVVVVCSIENLDPMGVHTGDSITVAPAMTLTDREYQRLRDIGIAVIRAVGVDTGGCNIQFAVDPDDGRIDRHRDEPAGVAVVSALASKATGFPIAKIAAKLAIGYTLDEIPNDITRETPASLRADPGLRRGQGAAVRVREVPRRRPDAHHAHEVGRRGDGDRPQLHRGAAEGAALAGEARTPPFGWAGRAGRQGASCSTRAAVPHDGRLRDGAWTRSGPARRVERGATRPPASTRGSSTRSLLINEVADEVARRAELDARRCCAGPSGTASPTPSSAQLRGMPRGRRPRRAARARHPAGLQDRRHLRRRVRRADAVPLLVLRRGDRGRAARPSRR